ncbi:MAG: MBL fold metallo-hydrolase, partial [Alicyclobacillaceae bacterium]|nr:MBL fold metallo-hydrolase [Alicyclobacillaceae bacterium]
VQEAIREHQRYLQDHAEGVDHVECIAEGRQVILGGRQWQVIDTPGHSSGHLSLFDAVTGEMIAGDHVLPHISSNALLEPPKEPGADRPRSLLIYIEALRKVAEMPVGKVYPGHGNPFRGVAELVDRRMEGYERRCSQLLEWLRERPLTIFELVRRMFPKLERSGFFLGVSEIVGHLDLLQIRGEVHVEERKGIWYYRADAPLVTGKPAVRDGGR